MNLKKIGGSVLAATLLAAGLAVVAVPGAASAHVPTVNATCTTLTVDAENYSASVPASEGSPGQPYIAGTPGIPAVPGTPEVPATYVQEFKFVFKGDGQHGGDKFEWHAADWTGDGWQKTGERRDSTTVLTPEVPATPGIPAVPGTPGQPYIAPTPGTDAKTNHVTVTIDGTTRAAQDFSTAFQGSWSFGDQTVSHTYRVVISSWDGIGNLDTGTLSTQSCVQYPVSKPVATVSVDNCMYDANGTPVDRPLVLSYDNSASTVPVEFTVDGFAQFTRTVAAGESTTVEVPFKSFPSGTLVVEAAGKSFSLDVPACAVPSPKPDAIVTVTSNTVTDCTARIDTTTTVTTTINFFLQNEDGDLSWVKDKPVVTSEVTKAPVTDTECCPIVTVPTPPVTVPPVPPVVVPPVTVPPTTQVVTPSSTPAPVVAENTSQQLAHTGSDIPLWVLWIAVVILVLGLAVVVVENIRRKRVE